MVRLFGHSPPTLLKRIHSKKMNKLEHQMLSPFVCPF